MKNSGATKRDKFDKELFKRSVNYNVKTLFRKTMEEATPQQIFQAVSYAIKDQIMDMWIETQEAYEKEDPKMVKYFKAYGSTRSSNYIPSSSIHTNSYV